MHVLEMGVRFTESRRQRAPPHLIQDDLALVLKQLQHHLGPPYPCESTARASFLELQVGDERLSCIAMRSCAASSKR